MIVTEECAAVCHAIWRDAKVCAVNETTPGKRAELAPHFASHRDINAIVDAAGDAAISATLRGGTAANLKRYTRRSLTEKDWFTGKAEDPYWILDTVEFKTAWHPIGM